MSEVINFRQAKEDRQPHNRGKARCLDCRHEWEAVALVDVVWLACPQCTLIKGRFLGPFQLAPGTKVWECKCGNNLFELTRTAIFCPGCGNDAVFPR